MENQMESFPQDTTSQQDLGSSSSSVESLPSLSDLEKMERFRFEGHEWTPKDLKNAIMRQQDYTRKTQGLAEERKSFDSERKYYENLYADLEKVKQSPHLASEFVKIYPQKFHQALRNILNNEPTSQQTQSQNQQQQRNGPDVDTLSRLAHLEKFYNEQEVSKNEVQINSTIDKLSGKYPDAIPELVIGRVFEAYSQMLKNDPGAKLTSDMWEDTFKSVDQYMKNLVATKYKNKQQEQLKANSKSKDVSSGGGTVGRAPQKFKDLKSVTDFAIRDLTRR